MLEACNWLLVPGYWLLEKIKSISNGVKIQSGMDDQILKCVLFECIKVLN